VTLDADVAARIQALARERGTTFKEALNSTLRRGLADARKPQRFRVRARNMGVRPGVDLDKALQLAGALEDAEIIHKMNLRK